jgi:hypothetical protein
MIQHYAVKPNQAAEQVPPDSSFCETGFREMTQFGALKWQSFWEGLLIATLGILG